MPERHWRVKSIQLTSHPASMYTPKLNVMSKNNYNIDYDRQLSLFEQFEQNDYLDAIDKIKSKKRCQKPKKKRRKRLDLLGD